ncbi:MAG: GDP-mannose 4,6-dehydratase [Saprospiraceae bacterium]|nr:GDP-mannose 4,6-dehydratase [Saprospiraceae bacterium]MBK8298470.1 GDP-mannose 4,6-dehydratase [Saprospiraceae bacterium]
MNILVTGAIGFIGSHLCEQLLKQSHKVIGLDNMDPYYEVQKKQENLNLLESLNGFKFIYGDIRNSFLINEILAANQIQLVIHLAAKAGVRPSISNASDYMDVNLNGLVNLLEACRNCKIKRFIFISSSSVYGNQQKLPFSETDDVSFPISPYAATKKSGELLCYTYHHLYKIETACLRLFTVYGPRQRPDLAIHKFTQLAIEQQPIELYGDGSSIRDYTFVSDIVDGICGIAFHPELNYEIFNLGNGKPVKLIEMVEELQNALQTKIEIKFIEKQAGDVDQTHADIAKANAYFGYQPKVSFKQGVAEFVNWFKKR